MKTLFWYGLATLIVIADQLTKWAADDKLQLHTPVKITEFFNLTLAYNKGAAWSFLADAGGWQRYALTIISALVSLILMVWLARLEGVQRWMATALTFVLGGAIGNLIDRAFYGHVVDFIELHYAGFYFPAFNIADIAISTGAFLLILHSFFSSNEADSEHKRG